jgi:hypothetical protein
MLKPNLKTRQQMLRILFGGTMGKIPRLNQNLWRNRRDANLRYDFEKVVGIMNTKLKGTKPSELSPKKLADLLGEILDGFNRVVNVPRRVKINEIITNIFNIRKRMGEIKRQQRNEQKKLSAEEYKKILYEEQKRLYEEQNKLLDIIENWNKP